MDENPAVIDAAHIARQRAFSYHTFGPGGRVVGVMDHIRKELVEIEAAPTDLDEWVDVVILAIDGAWRAGHEPQAIIDAIVAKQQRNEARTWPDWRTADRDKAIEHDRSVKDWPTNVKEGVAMPTTCDMQWWGIRPMVDHLPAITPHVCQGEPEHNDHHRCQCGAICRNQNRTEDKT